MTSREEIVLALKYFFDVETEASAHEIIGQESDPVDTIAAALDEYRKMDIQKSIEQFDVWFEANFSIPPISVSQQVVRSTMFSAWQASRNALEIKLPPAINTEEIGVAISKERTMSRLAFAGIKVKGE